MAPIAVHDLHTHMHQTGNACQRSRCQPCRRTCGPWALHHLECTMPSGSNLARIQKETELACACVSGGRGTEGVVEHVFSRCSRAVADEPAGKPGVHSLPMIVPRASATHPNRPWRFNGCHCSIQPSTSGSQPAGHESDTSCTHCRCASHG